MPYQIPDSVLTGLDAVPRDHPVAFLVRHSVRGPLPADLSGAEVPITDEGVTLATELGTHLGDRLTHLHTSPLTRCRQTAAALADGAGHAPDVDVLTGLGHVRTFMSDETIGIAELKSRGLGGVLRALFEGRPIPGFHDRAESGRAVLSLVADTPQAAGITAFVTHDLFLLAVLAAVAPDLDLKASWPKFLEGAFVWEEAGTWRCWYRGRPFVV